MTRFDEATGADLGRLRKRFDGDDLFLHRPQILRQRKAHRELLPWMGDRKSVSAFLRERFPKAYQPCAHHDYETICTTCQQKRTAMFWAFVIEQCFWLGETSRTAAENWNDDYAERMSPSLHRGVIDAAYVRRAIQQIRLASRGLRMDGKPRHGKPGRPRKVTDENTLYTSNQLIDRGVPLSRSTARAFINDLEGSQPQTGSTSS